jgi:hypothetical protein
MKRLSAIGLSAFVALLALGQTADAKTLTTVSYPYEQVFPSAVRFLRIDEGVKVIEKDSEAGYIVFELSDEGHTYQGSFEVARVRDQDGRNASRLVVRIRDRPAYMEQGLIDRFGLKLREELGEPAEPPPEKKPKPDKKKKKEVAKSME